LPARDALIASARRCARDSHRRLVLRVNRKRMTTLATGRRASCTCVGRLGGE
jgi:hypothetical protein